MIDVLDHGYVKFVESWGSDERIIEAARMSVSGGFVSWEPYEEHPKGDSGLLSYLWKNNHHSVFEMAGMTIEVQAPIFVFREWHRHRTQSYNELSARYTELPNLYYIPSVERLMNGRQATKNKQGSEEGFTELVAQVHQDRIRECTLYSRLQYEALLEFGVARELARCVVPVNQYSRMRASANLRNWLQFLELRLAPNAQWEIRQYSQAVGVIVADRFPRTWQLFKEGNDSTN